MDVTVFTTLVATSGAIVGAIAGGVLVGGAALLIDNRSERRKGRVARLQIQARLRAVFTPLQFAYENGPVLTEQLLSALRSYVAVASQPEILAFIDDDRTAKWVTNSATIFEVVLVRLGNEGGKYSSDNGTVAIPKEIRETSILGALSVVASTMDALGDRNYLDEYGSAGVKSAISELTQRNRSRRMA